MSTWVLENNKIRLKIQNIGGGVSVRSLYDKEGKHEWVYTQKEGLSLAGIYDSVYSGGFEFLFPTDEPCQIGQLEYQDHGFLWTTLFETSGVEIRENEQYIVFKGIIREMNVHVNIVFSIADESRTVHSAITFVNNGETPLPYLFRLHPSIRLSEHSRLNLNEEGQGALDFRELGKCDEKEIFCHIKQASGSFDIEEDNRRMLVTYDHCKLPILTLYFFNNGQKVVILEPATSGVSNVSEFPDNKETLLYDKDTYTFDFTIV